MSCAHTVWRAESFMLQIKEYKRNRDNYPKDLKEMARQNKWRSVQRFSMKWKENNRAAKRKSERGCKPQFTFSYSFMFVALLEISLLFVNPVSDTTLFDMATVLYVWECVRFLLCACRRRKAW